MLRSTRSSIVAGIAKLIRLSRIDVRVTKCCQNSASTAILDYFPREAKLKGCKSEGVRLTYAMF